MKQSGILLSLLCLTGFLGSVNCNASSTNDSLSTLGESPAQTGNQPDTDETRDPFLRLVGELKDQNRVSGDRLQFKCRIEGWPTDPITYTWYKDNELFDPDENSRFSIRNKPTISKLTIKELYTSDAGTYRCEVSNVHRRVHTSAKLTVSFRLPPKDDGYETKIPEGKCETYSGEACRSQLAGTNIYVDPFLTQAKMEQEITTALDHITNTNYMSEKCERYAYPAFCNFVFSPCEYRADRSTGKKKAYPIKLCREDCELMKHDVCAEEYLNSNGDDFLREIFNTANCSRLPATTDRNLKCTKVGLPSVSNEKHTCYNKSGVGYRGLVSTTRITGQRCKPWPNEMMKQHTELAGGHNYCRNPGNQMSMPWCYIDNHYTKKEVCKLDKCEVAAAPGSDMAVILIPSVAIPFIIGCIVLAFCVCRKKNSKKENGKTKSVAEKKIDLPVLSVRKGVAKLPELNATSVHLLVEVGDGAYGKVYKAKIFSNPQFSTNFPVAVKTLRDSSMSPQVDDFQREMEVFAELQHENVACLKAIVTQPSLRCMVFEYTDGVDLHEYLVSHSPQSDFAKPVSSASSHASSTIEHADFVRMSIQIASGMEYLSSNNYIHRDLAARNVLVCGNMDLKICNLGVVRDSYLSSYYRSPQGGQMLPIRWMAPESLQSWQFSDKSAVWSFGVLLWEMFSYGLQPYCGYSNHEVLDMISRRQLLTCPDQCPAKMYSLMHECWTAQTTQRPQFGDLRAKLQGWNCPSAGRVTSQLAQGIHRQLNSVMRDGSGQYNQFYQASSIGGSSSITCTSGLGSAPSPPLRYQNEYVPLPGSNPPSYASQQQLPPVSPNSHPSYEGNVPGGFQPTPPGHQYSGNFGGPLQHPGVQMPRRGQSFRTGPASHSSRSSGSCASSSKDQYLPVQPHRQTNGVDSYQEDFPQPPFSGPGNRSLEGVVEDENSYDDEEQFYQQPRGINLQNPPLIVTTRPASKQPLLNDSTKPNHALLEGGSDKSGASVRATSCDSGLPVEDVDGQALDSAAPLLRKGPRPPVKAHIRGGTPKKFI